MKACPFCAEQIQDAAIVCRFCNRSLAPQSTAAMLSSATSTFMSCPKCGADKNPGMPCVKCGYPRKRVSLFSTIVILAIFGFVAATIIGAVERRERGGATSTAAAAEPAISLSADDLFRAYQANEVTADQQYKGRILLVTGAVQAIRKDFTDSVNVEIWSPNEFMPVRAHGISEAVAAGLSVGQHVTLGCTGDGMILGSPVLRGCSVQ